MGITPFLSSYKGAIVDQMPDFTNIGAGLKALCRPALGQAYLWMQFFFTVAGAAASKAIIQAQVSNIRVLVDGIVKFELSGTETIYVAEYYRTNCVAATGVVPIFFARPWMEDLRNQDGPAYGLMGVDSFTVEITLAGGATINGIGGYATTTDDEGLGEHIVTTKLGRNFGSAGLETINDLPLDPQWSMYSLHFVTATVINLLEVLADGARVVYGVPAVLNQRLVYMTSPRGIQAGYTPIDLTPRNRNIDSLPLIMNKLACRVTWNAAPGAYGIITEVVQQAQVKGIPG